MEITLKTKKFDRVRPLLSEKSEVTIEDYADGAQISVANGLSSYIFWTKAKIIKPGYCSIAGKDLLASLEANDNCKRLRLTLDTETSMLAINSKNWLHTMTAM